MPASVPPKVMPLAVTALPVPTFLSVNVPVWPLKVTASEPITPSRLPPLKVATVSPS